MNVPAPSVTVFRGEPPVASRTSTVTPGSTSPVVSVTVPERAASWAMEVAGTTVIMPSTSTVDVTARITGPHIG